MSHHVISTGYNIMAYHICSHHTGNKTYHCPDYKYTFNIEANLNTCHQEVQSAPMGKRCCISVISVSYSYPYFRKTLIYIKYCGSRFNIYL